MEKRKKERNKTEIDDDHDSDDTSRLHRLNGTHFRMFTISALALVEYLSMFKILTTALDAVD